MKFLTLLIILILGAVGARSAVIKSDQLTAIQNNDLTRNDLDFIIGEITDNSILVFTERATVDYVFAVTGYVHESPLAVTRIEVINVSNDAGAVTAIDSGGLGFRHAILVFSRFDNIPGIDVIVNIYGEPRANNDITFGELTNTSFLIDSQRVTDVNFAFYEWMGNISITRLEAIDQTNGNGGFLWEIFWFNYNSEVLVIFDAYVDQQVDFIVNIYGEPLLPNHLILGEVTQDSIVVFNNRITELQANTFRFTWEGPYPLVRIEFFDQSNGSGGNVTIIQGGLNENSLEALLSRVNLGTEIDFTVILYADPRRPENE